MTGVSPRELDLTWRLNKEQRRVPTVSSAFTGQLAALGELLKELQKGRLFFGSFTPNKLQSVNSAQELQKYQLALEVAKRKLQDQFTQATSLITQNDANSGSRSQVLTSIKLIFDNEWFKCTRLHKTAKNAIKERLERLKQRKQLLGEHRRTTLESSGLRNRNEVLEQMPTETEESAQNVQETRSLRATFERDMQIESQNKQLKKANKQLDKIVANYQRMGEIVSLHGQMFEDIEMKTQHAEESVTRSRKTLQDIYQDVNSHRGFIVKLFTALTVIAVIYLILR